MNPAEPQPITFFSGGTLCRALCFEPQSDALTGDRGSPCVVMGHGFAGTVDAGLVPFARRFAAAGLKVLAFDYRCFGLSDGEPRQLLSISAQIDDWTAAVACARTLSGVDPKRIVLWGTSFSGGHVVEVAARDGSVAAVISQCPMMDGLAALRVLIGYAGVGYVLRLSVRGLWDVLRRLAGMSPLRLPVVGPPGSLGAMTTPDAEPGFRAIAPAGWRNEVCARIVLTIGTYRPGLKADRLRCPILILICGKDSVAPATAADAAARLAGNRAEVQRYPIGHFDIYTGDDFERSVTDQLSFLRGRLAVS